MFASLLLALGGASLASAACVLRDTNTSTTAGVSCPVVLEGRVPSSVALTDLDTANGIFNPDYVKGNNVSWSEALLFPEGPASRFDSVGDFKSVEVTINNASIFMKQYGFRRAGLQFANDSNEASVGYVGQKTLHWSIKADAERALNTSHEYLNVWHEQADYAANQFMFQTGQMIDYPELEVDAWKFFDRNMNLLWSVTRETEKWQNFAVKLDIDANTVQIYYSVGSAALAPVTEAIAADISGAGQFQIGILKKPTGTSDVANAGFQEAPMNEGLIYGGIFVEDSASGCISL